MNTFRSIAALLMVSSAVLTLGSCGDDEPTPVATTPTPAPTPVPTPTPTPTPTPGPMLACGAAPVSTTDVGCRATGATFQREVQEAIDQIQGQQPNIFDFGNTRGGPFVKSKGKYLVGLLEILQNRGLCANWDGEELQVKNTNEFNDQYDVLLASGHIRQGASMYRTTCSPAAFPLPQPPLRTVAGCPLPGSREYACGDDEALYQGDVIAAIELLRERNPGIFDGNHVRDVPAYYAGVIGILTSAGYCAVYDGEEIGVKRENEFSEQYDILFASGRVRSDGSHTVSCYPAAF